MYGSTGRIGATNRAEFKGSSILVARVGANAGSVYAVDGIYGVTDNTLVIRPKPGVNATYLTEFLKYMNLNRLVYGSGQPLVTGTMLKRLDVPVFDADEQARIACALNDANGLIAATERMIAKKRAMKQGMMQQLLTGKTRLPGFTGEWHRRRLGDMLSYEQPGRYLVQTTKQLEAGRTPVLTAGKTFLLGYTNETHGIYTDHPVIIFDDFTTDSKFVDFDFKAKSSAMKILSARSEVDLRFIYERMQLLDFPLGDHKRYWISEYSKQELDVPDLAEQRAISSVITDCDDEIDVLKRRMAKARGTKTGMVQELLTGRTRLPLEEFSA